ncbi:MAG: amidohydrolase family protein [Anaerolineae bacterium]|jgi:imidazolonepropionase-like amidohydrolase|nr:amidohydrolase family protein [Chloroflexota bacterium]
MPAIQGKLVYTGKSVLEDAAIAWEGQALTGVGTAQADVVAEYPVITPAFVDPHCHIGLFRSGEPSAESEGNEHMDPMLAHADVLDSIQMDDESFQESIEAGVLYSCVLAGSGNIIGGDTAVIRNYGANTNAALIRRAGIKAAFGFNPMHVRDWKGVRPSTRMGAAAILRAKLHDVRQKMAREEASEEPALWTAEETILRKVLRRELKLRVHVHKEDDVATVLRFVDEFNLDITVEHTADVHTEAVYAELRDRGISVVYGPMDNLPSKIELKHESWRNIEALIASGVHFGMMTDHPVLFQRNLLLPLRWFLRAGLNKQQALEIITRQNAELVGVDDLVGTLEAGKWASFICWNGDPFSLESYPVAVYAEGELIYRDQR